MIRMFARHPVQDFGAWKSVYDEIDAWRREAGVQGAGVFRSLDDANDVTVWHDFESEDEARAFVASDGLREAMAKAGVAGAPTIWFTRAA